LFALFAINFFKESNKKKKSLFFYACVAAIKAVYDLISSVLTKNTDKFFPLLGGFFFFILVMNWSGLVPGVGSITIQPLVHHEESKDHENKAVEEESYEKGNTANKETSHIATTESLKEDVHAKEKSEYKEGAHGKIPLLRGGTADLNTTIALGLISVIITQFYGFKMLGFKEHLGKYFNFKKDPMLIFLGPLEIVLEFARVLSYGFRLYGNIFAGEVLLTLIPFLLPIFLGFVVTPIFFMEIFVGVVQALVFVMLSSVFLKMAVSSHH
jgi:F-type H+-transporting ATPase subunit a